MNACMNKEQQIPEYQQAAKSAMEHTKEHDCVHTAHKQIEISSVSLSSSSSDDSLETLSDGSSDSGTREKPTKPVTPSNKSSTFTAKHKSDNEETSLKQPHQDAFTSKQVVLEITKRLHIECGFLDTEHLFMLPITWSNIHEVLNVNVDSVQNFYNAYCTPKKVFVDKDFDSLDPKIHGPRNYLQIFYVATLVD